MSRTGRAAWAAVHELEAVQRERYSTATQRVVDELRAALEAEDAERGAEIVRMIEAAREEVARG